MFPITTILSPVSAILVIVDRIHRNELNAVTIAFVASTIGGHQGPPADSSIRCFMGRCDPGLCVQSVAGHVRRGLGYKWQV